MIQFQIKHWQKALHCRVYLLLLVCNHLADSCGALDGVGRRNGFSARGRDAGE